MARNIFFVLVSTILVDNFILSKFLGICPFLGVSKKLSSAIGMSWAVTFVMVLASAVTWPVYTYLLRPNGLEYLNTLIFILVIASLVQLVETVVRKLVPPLYQSLGVYLPLITTNCAVLAITLLNVTQEYNFLLSVVNALGAGLGFMLAMVLFSGVRIRLENNDGIPASFRGLPITLVAASIVSIAFMGFAGVADGLFG
ncbi:electron transport complex protein RnfA [Oscillospiraceae bacterium MB08-C2-2]|nr:electron transport complex protein RnfA [Oscillospiraceae bacterium MB08-C2-2]